MYPGTHAARTPDKPAVVIHETGEVLTYGELEDRSARLANVFRAHGLVPGDGVALVSDNSPRMYEVYWACLRSGLYLTTVNHHLTPGEAEFIISDCGARAVVASAAVGDVAGPATPLGNDIVLRLAFGGTVPAFSSYEEAIAAAAPDVPSSQPRGADMLYSSGTTGRPKGIKAALPTTQVTEPGDQFVDAFAAPFGFDEDTVYLCPAPLYHSAPLRFGRIVTALGGTYVVLHRFDAETALTALDEHDVTHSQWVPTHFVRMLKLPGEVRARAVAPHHRVAIHAAAPCPREVKEQMLDWWGPIIHEYYGSTESAGFTMVTPEDWLSHPGTVGRPTLGLLRVCDPDGDEVAHGVDGLIYVERDVMPFTYHRDPEKTRSCQHPRHPTWTTVGDIGHVDDEGYLYLTDRTSFTIISGGVNIYPREIEDALIIHTAVQDLAVIGVPDADFGEVPLAVVQLADGFTGDDALRAELLDFLRPRIAGFKLPRRIDFADTLPRTPAGKLVKGPLREKYATIQ